MEHLEYGWSQFWLAIIIGAIIALLISLFTLWLIKNPLKPQIEKTYDINRNKTITGLLNDIYRLDNWVGRSILILTKQKGFDRVNQKSYRITKQEASRLEYYLQQVKSINKNMHDNDRFLLQYLEMDEYTTIATYVHNSANFFLFPKDETGKTDGTIPVFCLPQYVHIRIDYSTKLIKLFSKQIKPEFIQEWDDFLIDYKSPY